MKEFTYVITDENGIHARPAGLMVKEAQKFQAELSIRCGEKTASLKKLFAVMGLAAKQGNEVTVTADGPDEDAAANMLETFFKSNF